MRREGMSIAGVRLALVVGLWFGAAPGLAQDLGDCGHPVPGRSIPACSALIQSSGAASDKATEWLLLRGLSHLVNGDSDAAIADLDEVIRSTKSNAVAYVARGDAYLSKGQPERAIADYDQAVHVGPNHYEARLALREAGRVDTDPSSLEKELEIFGWEGVMAAASRRVRVSSLPAHKRHAERTFAKLDEAIRRNPADAGAYVKRGLAFVSFGERQFARAMADYNMAIRADPNNIDAYSARAQLHRVQGNWDLAIADADHALGLRGDKDYQVKGVQERFVVIYMVWTYPVSVDS